MQDDVDSERRGIMVFRDGAKLGGANFYTTTPVQTGNGG